MITPCNHGKTGLSLNLKCIIETRGFYIRQVTGASVVNGSMVWSLNPEISNRFIAGSNNVASPPPEPEKNSSATSSSSPEFAKTPPKTGNSSVEPATISSATKQDYGGYSWFPPGILIFFVPMSTHLYSSYTL